MMRLPSKETLVYYEKIDNWIASEELTDNGVILVFKKGIPSDVIELFEKIENDKIRMYSFDKIKMYK